LPTATTPAEEPGEQFGALLGLRMAGRHYHHFPPLGIMRILDQQSDLVVLDRRLPGQVLLERPVNEVDPADNRLAEQAAAFE
jgi:hypothetical protein